MTKTDPQPAAPAVTPESEELQPPVSPESSVASGGALAAAEIPTEPAAAPEAPVDVPPEPVPAAPENPPELSADTTPADPPDAPSTPPPADPPCPEGHENNWLEIILGDVQDHFICRCGARMAVSHEPTPATPADG